MRALTPDETAEAILRGVEKGSRLVVKPTIFRLLFLLNAVFPQRIEAIMCQRS